MPIPLNKKIKKEELKFDLEKLHLEDTTSTYGNDGDDPRVRHLKKMAEVNPRLANKIFERMQTQFSKQVGFEWIDRVKRKDVTGPPDVKNTPGGV